MRTSAQIVELSKLLKPTVELVPDTSMAFDDQLNKVLKQLLCSIEECTYTFENCHPLASRIYFVIKAELLVKRLQTSIMEFVHLLKDRPPFTSAELSPNCLEYCFENIENMGCEATSRLILEAIEEQSSNHEPQRLAEIAECLGLSSNMDILIEAVALEKLKENAEQAGNDFKIAYLAQLIILLNRMHDRLFVLEQSKICIPNSIETTSFICPLSLEIMRDPVLVSSGKAYERAYIRKWIDLGLTVCPKTRQTLRHLNLIPNYTMKALVANWYEMNKLKLPDPVKSVNLGLDSNVKKLVENLKSKSNEGLREATNQVRLFVKQNMDNRNLLTYFGGIRLAVNLLNSTDSKIQENAVTSLLFLAINNDNKVAIVDEDAIEPLIHVLEVGTPEARENSTATLFCLSMIHNNKLKIGRSGAIFPLVELLRNGTPQGRNNAVITLFNLSISHENRVKIVQAGGVRFLVKLASDPVAGMVDKAVFVLANLAMIYEGRTAIVQTRGIPVLVDAIELGSARGKENAAAALLQLCVFSSRFCNMVLHQGAVPPLVALSQSGTPRAREKAQRLLSYLRS